MSTLQPWSTRAINLPDHADNPVHTDAGAIAAGFERALVAGTTVHAYLTHPPTAAWGVDWLSSGGGQLRLRKPVFDDDLVDCTIAGDDDELTIVAEVGGHERASLVVWRHATPLPERDGEPMGEMELEITQAHIDYATRAGDDLALYATEGIAPPVTWSVIGNLVFLEHLVTGPWVHVGSRIAHLGLARLGDVLTITSRLVDRFPSRAGERALVDIEVTAGSRPIASIEHEAIIVLGAAGA